MGRRITFLGVIGKQGLQAGDDTGRQGSQFAFAVDGCVGCMALGEELFSACCIVCSQNSVCEFAGHFFEFVESGFYDDLVIIAGRCLKAGVTFDDGEEEAKFFNLSVGTNMFPHEFGAADLKKTEVIGVIDNSCGIGISIEYPVLAAMDFIFHCIGTQEVKFLFCDDNNMKSYREPFFWWPFQFRHIFLLKGWELF